MIVLRFRISHSLLKINVILWIGQDGNLRVTIKRYDGPSVQCTENVAGGDGAPSVESCKLILTSMPVDFQPQIFGPMGHWGDTSVDVIIPKTFRPRKRKSVHRFTGQFADMYRRFCRINM